jgi:methyl-accepting chemotaxis protein
LGFAVVAGEVKDLAQEVGRATEGISGRISAIQDEVCDAVRSIESVTRVISEINAFQEDIAGAVRRQGETSAEVSMLIGSASRDAESIAQAVTAISTAARETSSTAGVALASAAQLSDVAEQMRSTLRAYQF